MSIRLLKENNDIIADCGLHYYNYRLDCKYSKKLEYPPCKFTSLKTYLDDLGANFLMKNYFDIYYIMKNHNHKAFYGHSNRQVP